MELGHRLLVVIPGRKQVCFHCTFPDHWTSQCRQRKTLLPSPIQNTKTIETTTTNKHLPLSLSTTNNTITPTTTPDTSLLRYGGGTDYSQNKPPKCFSPTTQPPFSSSTYTKPLSDNKKNKQTKSELINQTTNKSYIHS